MKIAQQKRGDNIAEYILYLWQMEDLLRALKFDNQAIHDHLVAPQGGSKEEQQNLLMWYVELCRLLEGEQKRQSGHLSHTLHLIGDLESLHQHLLKSSLVARYNQLYACLQPHLATLRTIAKDEQLSDIELCFRSLYASMLLRLQPDTQQNSAVEDVKELVSPLIAKLSQIYAQVERGEIDLYEER